MKLTKQIQTAVKVLENSGLVAFPTETVYGLGADANNEVALRKIFAVKERPLNHPLIVHLARLEQMVDWAKNIPPAALLLGQIFWPGPLTLVLNKQSGVLDLLTGGQKTIALRVPRHPIAQKLLQAFDRGIAAPSANKFTHISPTTAAAVFEELDDEVDLILDGGDCEVGLESTILDLSTEKPTILRPGMISAQAIEHALGTAVYYANGEPTSRAPGMHHLHYAPRTKTILIETSDIVPLLVLLKKENLPAALLINSEMELPAIEGLDVIKMSQDAEHYAHDLYFTLRELDHQHYRQIFIENVPQGEAWVAIHDRLKKASFSPKHSTSL